MDPIIALAVSGAIAGAAFLLGALTGSGAVAATLIGTSILGNTGWPGFAVLGTFFAGSTALGRLVDRVRRGSEPSDETRDWVRVVANGGVAGVVAWAERVAPGAGFWLVTTTLAAATADTWATAFGTLSPNPPRDILTRARVPAGTSGGVTWFGTSGGLMGAAIVAVVGATVGGQRALYVPAVAIGFLGLVTDSILGSAVQARFRCPQCNQPTERRRHGCGSRTDWEGGWRWLDNSGVNLATTALAGAAGLAAWWSLSR